MFNHRVQHHKNEVYLYFVWRVCKNVLDIEAESFLAADAVRGLMIDSNRIKSRRNIWWNKKISNLRGEHGNRILMAKNPQNTIHHKQNSTSSVSR